MFSEKDTALISNQSDDDKKDYFRFEKNNSPYSLIVTRNGEKIVVTRKIYRIDRCMIYGWIGGRIHPGKYTVEIKFEKTGCVYREQFDVVD